MGSAIALVAAVAITRLFLDFLTRGKFRRDFRRHPLQVIAVFPLALLTAAIFWAIAIISMIWWISPAEAERLARLIFTICDFWH